MKLRILCVFSLMALMAGGVTAAGETPAPKSEPGTQGAAEATASLPDKEAILSALTGRSIKAPLDIPDDTGLFIFSADGEKALRIYGSLRLRMVYDSNQTFHAFDLNIPDVPTGEDDFSDPNSTWTVFGSRLGMDVYLPTGVEKGVMGRLEVDWKGTDEKFRIRHLFVRGPSWLLGKSWTSVTNLHFLPKTVDGHYTGAGIGTRPPQIRYGSSAMDDRVKYQVSAEYQVPTLIKPDEVEAEAELLWPAIAGRVEYEHKRLLVGLGGVVRQNQVQFTGDEKKSQEELGYGAMFGALLNVTGRDRIKLSFNRMVGTAGYYADWSYQDIDLIYDPATDEFENTRAWGGLLGYEHDWSPSWSSTVSGGYIEVDNKSFQDDLAFSSGAKGLVSLWFTPVRKFQGVNVGAEVEYAQRKNKDSSENSTTRASILMYYDF